MGCVSSSLLSQDEEFSQLGSNAFGHHIVSLTSTTYGLLTLDPPSPMTPPIPSPRFTLGLKSRSPEPEPQPEVINSWELMAGLDSNPNPISYSSFRFSPLPPPLSNHSYSNKFFSKSKDTENINPNRNLDTRALVAVKPKESVVKYSLNDGFPKLCPPNGENKVVLYTTTLRGVRKTFEACNAVRAVIQGLGFSFCERDISMDRGFREELNNLLLSLSNNSQQLLLPPRLFVKGRYLGGAEEVLRIHEQGVLAHLLQGLPRLKPGTLCDGCGDARFVPCFHCSGSCKLVVAVKKPALDDDNDDDDDDGNNDRSRSSSVMRCPDCNENGLVLCPICT